MTGIATQLASRMREMREMHERTGHSIRFEPAAARTPEEPSAPVPSLSSRGRVRRP